MRDTYIGPAVFFSSVYAFAAVLSNVGIMGPSEGKRPFRRSNTTLKKTGAVRVYGSEHYYTQEALAQERQNFSWKVCFFVWLLSEYTQISHRILNEFGELFHVGVTVD